jgi:hypothetical protein
MAFKKYDPIVVNLCAKVFPMILLTILSICILKRKWNFYTILGLVLIFIVKWFAVNCSYTSKNRAKCRVLRGAGPREHGERVPRCYGVTVRAGLSRGACWTEGVASDLQEGGFGNMPVLKTNDEESVNF